MEDNYTAQKKVTFLDEVIPLVPERLNHSATTCVSRPQLEEIFTTRSCTASFSNNR